MSAILNIEEMIECLRAKQPEHAERFAETITGACTLLADAIALEYNCTTTGATYEPGFDGIMAGFRPEHDGQICPPQIAECDPDSDWAEGTYDATAI